MRAATRTPAGSRPGARADALVPPALAAAPDPFEPKVCAALEPALPDGALVWVGSSMPIRDVEAFFPHVAQAAPLPRQPRRQRDRRRGLVGRRARRWRPGAPTFLLTGELALLHDLGGLLAARRAGVELTIVCANNGGGGIFDFLPVAEAADAEPYEDTSPRRRRGARRRGGWPGSTRRIEVHGACAARDARAASS